MIAGVLLFAPAITYMIWYSRTDTPPEYMSYLTNNSFSMATFNHAHYWFLGDLAWFFLFLTVAYHLKPMAFQKKKVASADPTISFLALFGIFTAIPFFVANLFFHADAWFSKLVIISFLKPTRVLLYLSYFFLEYMLGEIYGLRALVITLALYSGGVQDWLCYLPLPLIGLFLQILLQWG